VSLTSKASSLVSASPTGRVAEALSQRHRSQDDRPALRRDLVVRQLIQFGEVKYGVKNPENLKVYNFEESEWDLIRLFDGTRSPNEILGDYNSGHPGGEIPLATVLDFEDSLRKMDLFEKTSKELNLALVEKLKNARKRTAEEKEEGFNIFLIPFHVMDPDRFLNRTVKYVRWLWKPQIVAVALVIFVLTASVFVSRFSTIWAQTVELYNFLHKPFWDFLQFFTIMTVIGAIHEFGHAFAIKVFGGDVHDIGFALFYFTPAYYCDTTDAYIFPNKWHRLWVALGGIYLESYICAVATGLWIVTYPDTFAHEIAYKTMLYTGVSTAFFNINPMVKTDGYHILSSYLELPQMREESFQYIGALIQRYIFRLPVEVPIYSRRKRRIYLSYAPCAIAYTGLIMVLIWHIFDNLFSKIFVEAASVLATITFLWVFRKRFNVFFSVIRMFYLDKKEFLMSPKIRRRLQIAAGALLLVLAIPIWRQPEEFSVVLEPHRQASIEAGTDGVVSRILAKEGESVTKGQAILELSSPPLEADTVRASGEQAVFERQADASRNAGLAGETYRAQAQATAAEAALTSRRTESALLDVRSPISGTVLTPRIQDLQGRFVKQGTAIATVGDTSRIEAQIPVSERLVADFAPGQDVSLAVPSRVAPVHGTIVAVAPAATAYASPSATSTATASELPSEIPDRFVLTARFENPSGRLLPGMSGRVKVYTQRRSYIERGWRVVWHWIRTIVW